MSKTLFLPEHLAQKMNKGKADASDSSIVDGAYVDAKDRVLDPDLLDKSLLDRLPQPTGWRLLVMPYQGPPKPLEAYISLMRLGTERLWLLWLLMF